MLHCSLAAIQPTYNEDDEMSYSLEDRNDRELFLLIEEQADDDMEYTGFCNRKVRTTYRDHDVVCFFETVSADQIIAYRESVNWWADCGEAAFNNVCPSGIQEF